MSVIVDGKKYHVSITKGSTTYGFMIVRNSDGRKRINEWAPIYSTGDQQFAEGVWQPVSWTDFRGGLSLERYSNSAQDKFYTSKNMETRQPSKATLGGRWVSTDATQTSTANILDYLSNIYVGMGTFLRKYSVGAGTWANVNGTAYGASIKHLHVDGGLLFIALGDSVDAHKWNDTTDTTLTGFKASAWASYANKLWRATANNIYSSTDGGATWSAAVAVGSSSYNITALYPYNALLYIGKEDSLWTFDGTNTKQVLNFAHSAYSGNFKFMVEWSGYLFFNILRRVIRLGQTWDDKTPEFTGDVNKELYGFGIPVMFESAPSMLLVAFNGGENQYANLLGYDGRSWHQLYGPAVATMNAVGYSRAKDWVLVNDGSTRYQAQIAQADVASADYEASGEIVLPYFNGGFPWFKKAGKSVILETRDCTATETLTVSYRKDKDAAYTALGSAVVDSSAPTEISLDAINGALEFYQIQFKITGARGSDVSKRPILLNFTLRYINRPNAVHSHSVQVRLSARQRTLA